MKRSLIIFFISELLLSWCAVQKTFSQGEAGEDKICMKGSAGPVIGLYDDPLSCFTWEPKKGLSDPHSPFPTASPDSTTTYKLKIVGPDFSFTLEDEMTVYVIDKFKLEVENNLTECMENRFLTFTSTLEGDLPAIFTDQVEFILHYEGPDGIDHTKSELSYNATEDITVSSDIGPVSNSQHKYSKPFIAEAKYHGNTITSDTLRIDVFELWIDYVRFSPDKPWKAVIRKPFDLNGIGSSDCTDWDWDMDRTGVFNWNPSGGVGKTSKLTIPYSTLATANNSYFGDAFGTVIVKCKDYEGNLYSFKSTDMVPAQKLKVFYEANMSIDGSYVISDTRPPSWFVFWKEFIPLGKITDLYFAGKSTEFYGVTLAEDKATFIYDLAGGHNDETGHNGLHAFYETIAHESHHIVLWEGWWPSGYNASLDSDGDKYLDLWEEFDYDAIAAGFIKGVDDSYKLKTVGYKYEEKECRNVERSLNPALYDNNDWSYSDTYQGKQW